MSSVPGGVKPRFDGQGDGWAAAHRSLGPTFNMSDVDGVVGMMGFASNTGERLFLEYVPDNYKNRQSRIRKFATVAMFDRKSSEHYANSDSNALAAAFYLDLCRRLATTQPKPPRFFYVIGQDQPPWEMIEIDINTAAEIGRVHQDGKNWRQVWEAVGLVALRNELCLWIDPRTGNYGR